MSLSEAESPNALSSPNAPGPPFTRWRALAVIALVLSAGMSYWTGTASYEEQLADIVAARQFSPHVYEATRESPALTQLFIDAAGDRELTLKLELALIKYQDRARSVLELFGSDARFQQVLLAYGEGVIPIVDHFMVTDMATLWTKAKLEGAWKSIFEFFKRKSAPSGEDEPTAYGPRLRGIYAIEAIVVDGHHFLGQFVLDKNGQIQRVQTDRVLETIKKLFAGGVTDLEQKYRKGEAIAVSDVAWAGADVLSVFGVTKAVKYLGKPSVVGKPVEEAASVRRRAMMGRTVLTSEAVGKRVAEKGSKVASIYLLARHPSLLSGVFGALGKQLGFQAWLSILMGWWGIALVAIAGILPLLRGLTLLIKPIRWITNAAAWVSTGQADRSTNRTA
ncbi:hypothetical protein [Variovorax sp. 770b2]|uniref:hypothetical protein n=1 Tax=Variovorax sp. 770b2 TaxID=1566271 RepID=UPI0008E6BEEB|nr:hypothetical protein [Variovorax sp. 770b2]SFQ40916.1 hypothetical protein SAMN03159339_0367 [Variovorax sp. 770b2]